MSDNPYARPTTPTPRTPVGKGPWLIFGLWVICCLILRHVYGESPTWFWASWASLAAILAGVWVGRRINKRRAALLVVPVLAVAMVGLSPAPPANAYTYPSGCAYANRNVAVVRAGFTIAWVVTQVRVCQGTAGKITPSTYVSARMDMTAWGDTFGYSGHSGVDNVELTSADSTIRQFAIIAHARGCITQLGIPLCYPTQTFRVNIAVWAGAIDGDTWPYPHVSGSAGCTNNWCTFTGVWNLIPLVGLYFDPVYWRTGRVYVS